MTDPSPNAVMAATGLVCAAIGSAGGIAVALILPWQYALLLPVMYLAATTVVLCRNDSGDPS